MKVYGSLVKRLELSNGLHILYTGRPQPDHSISQPHPKWGPNQGTWLGWKDPLMMELDIINEVNLMPLTLDPLPINLTASY